MGNTLGYRRFNSFNIMVIDEKIIGHPVDTTMYIKRQNGKINEGWLYVFSHDNQMKK